MREIGEDADNDSKLESDNILAPATDTTTSATSTGNNKGFNEGQEWGWIRIENRKRGNFVNINPKVKGHDP